MSKRKVDEKPEPGTNGHHMEVGDRRFNCGYTIKDGKYFLSDSSATQMQRLTVEENALRSYIKQMNDYIVARFMDIEEQRHKWWKDIVPALQIPIEQQSKLVYDAQNNCIYAKSADVENK